MATSPKLARWLRRAILLLVAAALVLVVDVAGTAVLSAVVTRRLPADPGLAAEKKYRVASPVYHHDLAPMASVTDAMWGPHRYAVYTSSLGFKDASPREVPLTSSSRRVLFIGDSFTEGIGVDYPRTFVGLVDERLRARGVEVLNAGVSGYSPVIYYAKVKHLLETVGLRFDELVVYLDISDAQDEAMYYRLAGDGTVTALPVPVSPIEMRNYLGKGALVRFLDERTTLTKVLAFSLRDRRLRLHPTDPFARAVDLYRGGWTFDPEAFDGYGRAGLESMTTYMDRLLALVRARGISLTIAVYPWPGQIMFDTTGSRQVVHWRDWAAKNGAGFVDHFPDFLTGDRREQVARYFVRGDVHWNEQGHALVARRFLSYYESR
jgi:hypothetical protein